MKKHDFLIFIKNIDSLRNNKDLAVFITETYGLLDYWGKASSSYHIESSFNSREQEKIVKIIQVFKFKGSALRRILDLSPLRAYLKLINQRQKARFKLTLIEKLSKINIYTKRDNDFLSINFDFDIARNQIVKISLYFNPEIETFKAVFGEFIPQPIEFQQNLELVGVDLLPNEKIFLKTYRHYKDNIQLGYRKANLGEQGIVAEVEQLGMKLRYPFLLFLDKIELGKQRWKFGGCYLYCENNKILDLEMQNFKFTALQKKFFQNIKKMLNLNHFRISFFVIKPKQVVEIYFL
jgi:hypothetical protein